METKHRIYSLPTLNNSRNNSSRWLNHTNLIRVLITPYMKMIQLTQEDIIRQQINEVQCIAKIVLTKWQVVYLMIDW